MKKTLLGLILAVGFCTTALASDTATLNLSATKDSQRTSPACSVEIEEIGDLGSIPMVDGPLDHLLANIHENCGNISYTITLGADRLVAPHFTRQVASFLGLMHTEAANNNYVVVQLGYNGTPFRFGTGDGLYRVSHEATGPDTAIRPLKLTYMGLGPEAPGTYAGQLTIRIAPR